ncbi:hypothetical protein EVA_13997 [gut metagenome]|uniref:Uncharacterized protein n=1 Tax=gut metagenome TaxID=749906 RepID=J9CD40_9ZZZZ
MNLVTVHIKGIVTLLFNRSVKKTVAGVILQQVSINGQIARCVDRHNFHIVLLGVFVMSAKNVAADTTKTGNSNSNRHLTSSFSLNYLRSWLTFSTT